MINIYFVSQYLKAYARNKVVSLFQYVEINASTDSIVVVYAIFKMIQRHLTIDYKRNNSLKLVNNIFKHLIMSVNIASTSTKTFLSSS